MVCIKIVVVVVLLTSAVNPGGCEMYPPCKKKIIKIAMM